MTDEQLDTLAREAEHASPDAQRLVDAGWKVLALREALQKLEETTSRSAK